MRRITKTTKKFLTLLTAFCMVFALATPVMAQDGGAIITTDDPTDSVMVMTLGYEDDAGNYERFQSGTCFLINDEYVLTNRHVVTIAPEDWEAFKEFAADRFGADTSKLEITDKHIKLYMFVNRDMKVEATMHESVNSADMDFAAVKLAEKIYDRKPVALGDSDAVEIKEEVFAMGFPKDSWQTKDYHTKEDVSTVAGKVSKLTETGNVDVIEHTAPLNDGNSGGPLLDENNNVIGVNTFVADKKNYSVQINYIKNGLDTFGIPYAEGAASASEPIAEELPDQTGEESEKAEETTAPVEDNSAILAELQAVLDEAKDIDTKGYTEESVEELDDRIGAAEAVLGNAEAEAAEIQGATDDLNDAINNLEEKSGPNMMLIAIIGAAAVIVIIIIIIIVMGRGKKKAVSVNNGPQVNPVSTAGGYAANTGVQVPPIPENATIPEGAGETMLLDSGAGETTLLSNAGGAYLIRKKNGEKIVINTQNFKIGKERRRVNYCISDNTSVSRVHCEIIKKGADYYAVDQGATNYTFVNGIQLSPKKETLLSDCSVLKLSDEEFEFHLA